MATTHDIFPLFDIQNVQFADQYQLGAWWARYGEEQGTGPQSDTYFILNVTDLIEIGGFTNPPCRRSFHLGFFLGMVHGRILDPQTNRQWPFATTLVTLSDPPFTRGYRAGRVWFFYEADEDERRLTESYVMQRLSELASERHEYNDEQSTIRSALGCLLGELSGQVFPLTLEEHEQIQEEDRQFLAEYDAQHTKDALPVVVLP